jgi:hypothetical protein
MKVNGSRTRERAPSRAEALYRHLAHLDAEQHEIAVSEAHGLDPQWIARMPGDAAEVQRLVALVEALRAIPELPEQRNVRVLRDRLVLQGIAREEIAEIHVDLDAPRIELPRWPSGVEEVDRACGGGLYGLTLVSGPPGLGKSMFALGSALRAAEQGIRTLYLDCELDAPGLLDRVSRAMQDTAQRVRERLRELRVARLEPGSTRADLASWCVEAAAGNGGRVLVVVDSLHSLARMWCAQGQEWGFFAEIRSILQWGTQARRDTHGAVSFLAIGELGLSGKEKGGTELLYAPDLALRLVSKREDVVEIEVVKARSSATRKLGEFVRDWRRGRFVRVGAKVEEEREEWFA